MPAIRSRKGVYAALALVVLVAATLVATRPSPAQAHDLGFTVFYVDPWWTGFAAHAYEGQSYGNLGTLANKASSLVSHSNWYTCVWRGPNFTGQSRCFVPDASVSQLSTLGWDNDIESVRFQQSACQCTHYVVAKKGLTGTYGNAQTWDDILPAPQKNFLQQNGYTRQTTPAVGDIVVYDGSRFGSGSVGHVGVIQAVTASNLTVRGANQNPQGTEWDANCPNVNTISFVRGTTGETYWRK